MNRLTLHHTGGAHRPNAVDLRAYHRVVGGDGVVHLGVHPISANAPGRPLRRRAYAAHTARLNTGNIGLAVAAMHRASWSDPRGSTRFPPTAAQMDATVAEAARLCQQYGIEVTRRTVLTHAEVEPTLGVRQANKWDFDYDPLGVTATRDPIEIGDKLRDAVAQAMGSNFAERVAVAVPRPVIRWGSRGDAVAEAQRALGVTADSIFGPKTDRAVRNFQRRHQLLIDGIVGRMTWAALLPG